MRYSRILKILNVQQNPIFYLIFIMLQKNIELPI